MTTVLDYVFGASQMECQLKLVSKRKFPWFCRDLTVTVENRTNGVAEGVYNRGNPKWTSISKEKSFQPKKCLLA